MTHDPAYHRTLTMLADEALAENRAIQAEANDFRLAVPTMTATHAAQRWEFLARRTMAAEATLVALRSLLGDDSDPSVMAVAA